MRALTLFCLTLIAASPANAELRDLRASLSGSEGLVWISFDGQPTSVRSEISPSGLDLMVEGVSVGARLISPRNRELVVSLQVEPGETGAHIRLQGTGYWAQAGAELRQGGVLVRVQLANADGSVIAARAGHGPARMPMPDPHPAAAAAPVQSAVPQPVIAPVAAAAPVQRAVISPSVHTAGPAEAPTVLASPPVSQAPAPAAPTPASPATASRVSGQAAANAAAALPGDVTACAAAAAAVEANPWDDARLMQHAACLGRAGESVQASRIYEQMLAFEPDNVGAALALAGLRLQQGDRAAARSLYLRAAEHANSDADAMLARSQAEALRPQ